MPSMKTFHVVIFAALTASSFAPATSGQQVHTQGTPSPAPPQSPLKVRGGSMTFFSKGSWQPSIREPKNRPYCTFVDTTYLDFYLFTGTHFNDFPLRNLSPNWTVEIYGREKNGTTLSSRGVTLKAGKGCFGQSPDTTSVTITPMARSEFNSVVLQGDTFYTDNRRFHDLNCSGSDTDLDACERIKKVVVTIPAHRNSLYTFLCGHDCEIDVGEPQ